MRWAATKNPSARPDQSWISLIRARGSTQIRKPECPHEEGKLEEPGDKTDQEKNAHTEIQKPSDNLHVHDRHTLPDILRLCGER